MKQHKPLSGGLFGLILICFFLPFVTVSCGGTNVVTFTGLNLAIGTEFGEEKIDPEPVLLISLAVVLLGLVLSFLAPALLPAGLGLVNAVLLVVFRVMIDQEALREGEGAFGVSYEVGYWLALLASFAVAAFNGYVYWTGRSSNSTTDTG